MFVNWDVAVVGGGAAGYFGAIACAEANPAARVVIFERGRNPLAKVRISGGGRCNVTHACFDPAELVRHYPRGGTALLGPFTRFQPRDTVAWFAGHGVTLKTERDGRMFPDTDSSETIVACLTRAAQAAGVTVTPGMAIRQISRQAEPAGGGFELGRADGAPMRAKRVLLATGSAASGWDWARGLGHSIVPPAPSLFTFEMTDSIIDGLAGVAVADARVSLAGASKVPEQRGPVLITHRGLSGPAVLKLSAWGARQLHDSGYRSALTVCWLPEWREDALIERLSALKHDSSAQRVWTHSPFAPIPNRLWARLCSAAEILEEQRWAKLPRANMLKLAAQVLRSCFEVSGKGAFKEEFVTAGGVALAEVNFKTMESRICPGLYFAGEVLDIDAETGGFNFQAAWTTGWHAGRAMAESER